MATEIQISFGILIGFLKTRTTQYTAVSTTDTGPIFIYFGHVVYSLECLSQKSTKGCSDEKGSIQADCK